MAKFGLLVRLEAKPGKQEELAEFLKSALPLALQELFTINWFAYQAGPNTFGIFDTFDTEEGRSQHLKGPIAEALLAHAPGLLASGPVIEPVELLASK
ncbi:MAG: putative quinol monooxygenase [Mucilaginibacter sp.]